MPSARDLTKWLPFLVGPLDFLGEDEAIRPRRKLIKILGADITDDPENEMTILDLTAAGGGASDGENVGGEVEVFKDLDVDTLRFRTLAVGADKSLVQNANTISLRPVPPGHVNVKDYGAVGNGVTDDLAAFKAALATNPSTLFVPPGNFYLSDDLVLRKAVTLHGVGHFNDTGDSTLCSTITFAAGKGVIVEWPPGSGAAIWTHIRQIQFVGAMLTLPAWQTSHAMSVGDVRRSPTNDDNRYWFEVLKAGTTDGTAPDMRLAYNPYTGATRQNAHAYVTGDRVHDMSATTTRFFECTTAGTSGGSTPSWNTTPGGTTTDGSVTWTARDAAGYFVDDNGVIWCARQGSGVWYTITCSIEQCNFENFTTYAILGQSHPERNNTDNFHIDHCRFVNCGGGFATRGYDSQAGSVMRCRATGSGINWGVGNKGGCNFWDGSFLGNFFFGCNSQAQTGYGFLLGYPDTSIDVAYPDASFPGDNTGGGGTVVACYDEGDGNVGTSDAGRCRALSGFVLGGAYNGRWRMGIAAVITPWGANGLTGRDQEGAKHASVTNIEQGSDTVQIIENDDNGRDTALSIAYESPGLSQAGWWQRMFGTSYSGRQWSGATAAEGPGWEWAPFAEYRGGTGDSTTGRYFVGLDASALTTARKANHHWDVGDRFELKGDGSADSFSGYVVKTAGYRAPPWPANTVCSAGTSWCEPIANGTPIPTPGGQVWKCTTGGTTHATTEPTWPGSPTPDVTTVSDGTVVWTYKGTVAEYNYTGWISGTGTAPGGGGTSAGGADAVQTSDGAGGFVDSGLDATSTDITQHATGYSVFHDDSIAFYFGDSAGLWGILRGNDHAALMVDGAYKLDATNNSVDIAKPLIGREGNSSPYGKDGMARVDMTGGSLTVADSDIKYGSIKFVGTPGGASTATMPAAATDPAAFYKFYWNATNAVITVDDGNGGHTSVALGVGKGAWLLTDSDGVHRMSADVTP